MCLYGYIQFIKYQGVLKGRGSVKAPSFIFKKNIKFLILGIDNICRLVYYIIKIKGKEINKNDKRRNF